MAGRKCDMERFTHQKLTKVFATLENLHDDDDDVDVITICYNSKWQHRSSTFLNHGFSPPTNVKPVLSVRPVPNFGNL